MWIARTARAAGTAGVLALAMACSENNDLEPGTFAGALAGARSGQLSGSATAGTVYTETGVSYAIALVVEGQEDVFLSVSCPGDGRPGTGTHPIGTTGDDCTATYRRTVVDPFTEIERADAVSGTLVLRAFESDAVSGSLEFTGSLVVGETETGQLTVSARFAALPIGGAATLQPLPAHAPPGNDSSTSP